MSEPDYGRIDVPETPTTDEEIEALPVLNLDKWRAWLIGEGDELPVGTFARWAADYLQAHPETTIRELAAAWQKEVG
jgi:hypothetical protein